MNIAIIGPGNIGGNLAKQFANAGHNVTISFSRTESRLQEKAEKIGRDVTAVSVIEAVKRSDVIILSLPWDAIDDFIHQAGDLSGKIIIDATNQYTATGLAPLETSVAVYNQTRMSGAKLVRTFNMFTAAYQAEVANSEYGDIPMFFATEAQGINDIIEQLIQDAGFKPVYLGGWDKVRAIEAPDGELLGKVYSPKDAADYLARN